MNSNKKNLKLNFEVTNTTNEILDNFKDNFDTEIFDLVVILNNLGFRTFASCQGHPNCNTNFYPMVLFCDKEVDNIYFEGNDDKVTNEFAYKQYSLVLENMEKLMVYLNEFYKNRTTIMSNRLIIKTTTFYRFILQPSFSPLYKTVKDVKEQEKLNKIYLEEVYDFTKFLESKI